MYSRRIFIVFIMLYTIVFSNVCNAKENTGLCNLNAGMLYHSVAYELQKRGVDTLEFSSPQNTKDMCKFSFPESGIAPRVNVSIKNNSYGYAELVQIDGSLASKTERDFFWMTVLLCAHAIGISSDEIEYISSKAQNGMFDKSFLDDNIDMKTIIFYNVQNKRYMSISMIVEKNRKASTIIESV